MRRGLLLGGVRVEGGICRPRPFAEERDRGVVGEWLDRVDMLAGEVEDDAARDEEGEARRVGEQLDVGRRGGTQVLDVIEDEQQLARPEGSSQRLQRSARELSDSESTCDRSHD